MADLNSTSPNISNQVNNNETPSHYEKRLDSFPIVSEKISKIIIDTDNNISSILIGAETKKEINELNEEFKLEFLKKLKLLPDYEGSKVQEAIEKGTILLFKVHLKDKIIISLDNNSLDYIFNLDGTKYFNLSSFRKIELIGDMVELFIKEKYGIIYKDNTYILNGKKIDINDKKILEKVIEGADMVLEFKKNIKKEAIRRGI